MTRKIGEKFKYGENTYIVVQTDRDYPLKCIVCDYSSDCVFRVTRTCNGILRITGDCISKYRDDKTSVIFKKIINQ